MRKLLLIFIALVLFACNHSRRDTLKSKPVDTIRITTEAFADTSKHFDFLAAGIFHEVISSAQFKHKWKGVFYHNNRYYVADTKVTVKAVRDTMAGEEAGQATASLITTDVHDQNILLISENLGLVNGPVKYLELKKDQLLPSQQLQLNYNGKQFILYATGKVVAIDPTKAIDLENINTINNYNLFIKGEAKGHYFDQLLVHIDFFESGFATAIEFAGDIDGDQIPDFIINTSNYGLGGSPTLYLSKQAGPKMLLVEIGGFTTAD